MIRSSEQTDELVAALVKCQGQLENVKKDQTANTGSYRYSYADLAAVVEAARPIISDHGLAVTQFPGWEDQTDVLTSRLLHTSGQWLESSMRLMSVTNAQAHGSALTYARRYAYCAILGIVTEDDDGAAATAHHGPASSDTGGPTSAQLGLLRGLIGELGMSTDEARRDATKVAGRDIGNLSDLTKPEASKLIDLWKAS